MASNQTVYAAFWKGELGEGSNTHSTGDKLFSYSTVILQRLSDGSVIGNVTKYSSTTSLHQARAGVNIAEMLITGVPRGANDLIPYTPIFKESDHAV